MRGCRLAAGCSPGLLDGPHELTEGIGVAAFLISLFGALVAGAALVKAGGGSIIQAARLGLWMMLYSLVPVFAVAALAAAVGGPYRPWILATMPLATFAFYRRLVRVHSNEHNKCGAEDESESGDAGVIQAYGRILEHSAPTPGCIADASKLPFPKERIREALKRAIGTTADERSRQQLGTAYLLLADWQPGVGKEAVGIDLVKGRYSDDAINRAGQLAADSERARSFEAMREQELERLRSDLRRLRILEGSE